MKIKQIKTMAQAWKQLLSLGALTLSLLLSLVSAAEAGSWRVSYRETLNYNTQGMWIGYDEVGRYTRVRSTKVVARHANQGPVTTVSTSDGVTRLGYGEDHNLGLWWDARDSQGRDARWGAFHRGAVAGHASGKRNVRAFFHWERQGLGEDLGPDPNDNPPALLYVWETAAIGGEERFSPDSHPVTSYNAQHPFKGTQFSFKNVSNPLGGNFVSMPSQGDYQSAQYFSEGTRVTCIKTNGRTEVPGPDRSFSGAIDLNASYGTGDTFGYGHSGHASLSFNYSAAVVDFRLSASGMTFQLVPQVNPNNQNDTTYDAFVTQGWKINPGDGPEVPLRRFWSGSALYGASATVTRGTVSEDVFSPQIYEWTNSGAGSLLLVPPNTTQSERPYLDITGSWPSKNLTHDLGEFTAETLVSSAREFPKKTVVEGKIKDAEGRALKGKATINWHTDYVTVYEVALSLHVDLPEGETLDPDEFPDDDGLWEDPNTTEEGSDWEMVERIDKLRRGTPREFARAGNQTVTALGHIVIQGVPIGRVAGLAGRTIPAGAISRILSRGGNGLWARALSRVNQIRLVKNKAPVSLTVKTKVTVKGSGGKIDRRRLPPGLPWWPDGGPDMEDEEDEATRPGTINPDPGTGNEPQTPPQNELQPQEEPDGANETTEKEHGRDIYFVHGTTTGLWGGATAPDDSGGGDFGAGFYTYRDSRWARETASEWARRKAAPNGGDGTQPILVFFKMKVRTFEALTKQYVPDNAIDTACQLYRPDGLTGSELVYGAVARNAGGGIRVADKSKPDQYKFEGTGIGKLQFAGITPAF